ncbi:hypothetical protein NQ314_000939 [Rhamnusium bicolor]|uniref:Uncharacterized protein n=1 Tax=Rhamnusium bicolor TaxID=1586634 RepID=A0AAV8ZWP9_9CUCU|nr:hypothetical protein NQ314_000939 [Rhamnusium bicolor]
MFLGYFWGNLAQEKVREDLYTGIYDEARWMSREQYAMKKINLAKYLEPVIEESDIVKYVARRYEENIRETIVVNEFMTIKKLLQYLKRVDDRNTPGRKNFI